MQNIYNIIYLIKKNVLRFINFFRYIYLELLFRLKRNEIPKYKFYSNEELFENLIKYKKSLTRFGDGEIRWISQTNKKSFQENSELLSQYLIKCIDYKNENLIIGIPDVFDILRKYKLTSRIFWRIHLKNYRVIWMYYFCNKYTFANSLITRPYMINKNKDTNIFEMWKKVWNNRKVIIIEGDKTFFGVGNDLLSNSANISRIIAPSENAFNQYERILDFALSLPKDDYLFLAALGPTASILASELSKRGLQCIDIGHLDLEYEWMIRKVKKRINIPGKYNNESYLKYIEPNFNRNDILEYQKSIIIKIL